MIEKIITKEIARMFIDGPHEEKEVAPGMVVVSHPVTLDLFKMSK